MSDSDDNLPPDPFRVEHGKLRPSTFRMKDVAMVKTAAKPTDRDPATGRYLARNNAASNTASRRFLKRTCGVGSTHPESLSLVSEIKKKYESAVRHLPVVDNLVRFEAAALARWATASDYFAAKALEAGWDTPDGQKYLELSQKHDDAASRHATNIRGQVRHASAKQAVVEGTVIEVKDSQAVKDWAEAIAKVQAEQAAKGEPK